MKLNNQLVTALSLIAVHTAGATPYLPFYDTTLGGPVQISVHFNASSNYSGFNSVEATLVMPRLSLPLNPRERVDQYTAFFWIGLDGFVPSTDGMVRGLWQAGVTMSIWDNGTTEYSGFHEWIPDEPISLSKEQLAISEGDHIRVVVNTTDAEYRRTTTLTNLNTSQTFSHSQDAAKLPRGPTFPAPGASAEWIIEAGTYLNYTQVIFPDWGNASILDARACYSSGECVKPGDLDTGENNTRMTVVLWNDTQTVYTESSVDEGRVWIAYVETPFEE
ncbi:concanavalin A-like lectin/glucanase [Cadophora sp. DSE1049]|nr:concanavalin A-like lectin/glucanase [Cadophora sp. DSE1049]